MATVLPTLLGAGWPPDAHHHLWATDMTRVSEHFTNAEFTCKCGQCAFADGGDPHLALLAVLEDVRAEFGPVTITPNGGRRCPDWNKVCGGAPRSQHIEGNAADIVVFKTSPIVVYEFLTEHPLADRMGLGSYDSFTHVDVRGSAARWVG